MTLYKHIKVHIGDNTQRSHIDAVHAQNPKSDQYTGEIVSGVIKKINASGIIATVSRTKMDINRPRNEQNAEAIDEYRKAIYHILASKDILGKDAKLTKQYLHLAVHGMRDDRENEFEIGSRNGQSCSQEVIEWFMREIKNISIKVELDNIFSGDQSKVFHRHGDPSSDYSGYGENFNTIQIEINKTLRKYHQKELIDFFSNTMLNFDKLFNLSINNNKS